jgi:hypothetical protein
VPLQKRVSLSDNDPAGNCYDLSQCATGFLNLQQGEQSSARNSGAKPLSKVDKKKLASITGAIA